MSLDKMVSEIFNPHVFKIKEHIVNEILEDTVDTVLECIYKEINEGKIRLDGVLNKDAIVQAVISRFHTKDKPNES